MLVSRDFGFVHMPRTGGTWLDKVIREHAPADWLVEQDRTGHLPAREARPGLKLWGMIRNPWDWYVSVYFFHARQYEEGLGSFSGPVEQWTRGAVQWARAVDAQKSIDDGFVPVVTDIMKGRTLQTWRMSCWFHKTMCSASGDLLCRVGRFERLRHDALASLRWAVGGYVPTPLEQAILGSDPFHGSTHLPYRQHYSKGLIDLVREQESQIVNKFGYEF